MTLLLFNVDEIYGDLSPLKDNIVSKSYASLVHKDLLRSDIELKRSDVARSESLDFFEKHVHELGVKFYAEAVGVLDHKELLAIKEDTIVCDDHPYVGTHLTELRKKLIKDKRIHDEKSKKETINKIYTVYTVLKQEFETGENDLSAYLRLSVDDIIKQRFMENKPITIIDYSSLTKLTKEEVRFIDFLIEYSQEIAQLIRHQHYKTYNISIDMKKEDELVSYYIDRIVNQRNVDAKLRLDIKRKLLSELEAKGQLIPLMKRLTKLKEMGNFEDFEYTLFPLHENDVKRTEAQKHMLDEYKSPAPSNVVTEQNGVFHITKDSYYHPESYTYFKLGLFEFPTVMHYIYFKMFIFFNHTPIESYKMLKQNDSFIDIKSLKHLYHQQKHNYLYKKVMDTSKSLLDKKYKYVSPPSSLIKLLLGTKHDYHDIVFNDKHDYILGVGDGKGENFIGKYLKMVREQLFDKYGKDLKQFPALVKQKPVYMSDILKDESILSFSKSKTKDVYDMMKQFQSLIVKDVVNVHPLAADPDMAVKNETKTIVEKYTDMESFQFIFKNFLSCMSKYYIEKFDKTKIPTDFHKEFDVSKEGLAELWSYMFHTYAYTKQINKPNVFKLMINRRDQSSLHALKQLKVAKEDSFDLFKQMPSYEYKEGEFKETVFDEMVLKDSDRVNILDYRKLKASSNSAFSSLLPKHIQQVERVFNDWFDVSDSSTIVDATAHIGVDSIHFATMFKHATIESYEIDKNVAGLLTKNVKTFSLSDRIHVHPMNFLQSQLPDNVLYVYIDAPWGGRDYKKMPADSFELFLGQYNIKEIAKRLLLSQKTKSVVLKVPRNYRFSDLSSFHVERKDIKDGTKVSYVLLKLTLSEKTREEYLIKSLAIQSFLCIFDTLKAFKPSFVLDKNSIKFAFHVLYLKDGTISLKEDVNSFFYEELVRPYLGDLSDPMTVNQLVSLSSILKQCVDHIVQSVSVINKNDVISRLLLFSSSKQIKYKDSLKSDDDNEPLFVPEEEKEEEEEVEHIDGLSDLDELNIDNDVDVDDVGEENGEEMDANEVEDETGEYDFDVEYEEDEYQNTD